MRTVRPLIKRQLRKRPGQVAVFLVMSLLAAMLLHVGLLMFTSYLPNIDRAAKAWNSPDAIVYLPEGEATQSFIKHLAADERITKQESATAQGAVAAIKYGSEELMVFAAVMGRERPELGQFTLVESTDAKLDNPIWAPAVLGASGIYRLGDPITLKTLEGSKTFHVQGFVEDTYGGVLSSRALLFRVPNLGEFSAPGFQPVVQVQLQSASKQALDAQNDAIAKVKLATGVPFNPLWDASLDVVRVVSGITSSVLAVLLMAFAGVVVVVMTVVMRFVLRNAITTDIEAIGSMRAAGFTSRQVMASLIALFAGVASLGAALGIASAFPVLLLLREPLRAQSGLSWRPEVSPLAILITLGVVVGIVVLTAWLATRRVRRMTTVDALRGGLTTHTFTRSPLPLAKTRGPLSMVLGLKAGLQQVQQSIVLAATVAVVAGAGVFSVGLTNTLLGDETRIMNMLIGDVEDVTVYANDGTDVPALKRHLAALPEVSGVGFSTIQTGNIDGRFVMLQIVNSDASWRYNPVYEGRVPRHDNEIVLGPRTASRLGLSVGDQFATDLGAGKRSFLVTGLATGARGGGEFLILTTEGFQLLDPTFEQRTLALYVTGDVASAVDRVKHAVGQSAEVNNTHQVAMAELDAYLNLIPAFTASIQIGTALVVVLVVSLVVTTMLIQTRRSLGIKKAMGYTHAELSAQTRWTYLPPVISGTALGAGFGALALEPLLRALLRGVGIMKVNAQLVAWQFALIPLGVIALAWLVTWIASLRIRSVSAYALVTE